MVKEVNSSKKCIGNLVFNSLNSNRPQNWEINFFEVVGFCFGYKFKNIKSDLLEKVSEPKVNVFFNEWMMKYASGFVSYSFTSMREAKSVFEAEKITSSTTITTTATDAVAWGFVDLTVVMGKPALEGGIETPNSHCELRESTYDLANPHTMVIGSKAALSKVQHILKNNKIGYVSIEELSETQRLFFKVPKVSWDE